MAFKRAAVSDFVLDSPRGRIGELGVNLTANHVLLFRPEVERRGRGLGRINSFQTGLNDRLEIHRRRAW